MAKTPMTSPLHRVIDAGQWDAERLLGRLIIVVHAALLDAGFVPATAAAKDPKLGRIRKQVGATASTLSLRYALPQQDAAAATLRVFAQGWHLVFYVRGDGPLGTYWVCLDALAAARPLSGGLDDTARALMRNGPAASLWIALADGLCRRVLYAMCREKDVVLEPSFMSLPVDAKEAIRAKIDDGIDLLSVTCTCTELRRFVTDRDAALWKPIYEALGAGGEPSWILACMAPVAPADWLDMAWKERYLHSSAVESIRFAWSESESDELFRAFFGGTKRLPPRPFLIKRGDHPGIPSGFSSFSFSWLPDDQRYATKLLADLREALRKAAAEEARARKSAVRHRRAMASVGGHHDKWRHGAGAIYSPSSRCRWGHR